mmetsp:Transcript_29074/g.90996  ORF Transcript_29074/g.90996 Transcript_29074/m.90996 type:complete len:212 (+) Transcript_29074:484-1119(+)
MGRPEARDAQVLEAAVPPLQVLRQGRPPRPRGVVLSHAPGDRAPHRPPLPVGRHHRRLHRRRRQRHPVCTHVQPRHRDRHRRLAAAARAAQRRRLRRRRPDRVHPRRLPRPRASAGRRRGLPFASVGRAGLRLRARLRPRHDDGRARWRRDLACVVARGAERGLFSAQERGRGARRGARRGAVRRCTRAGGVRGGKQPGEGSHGVLRFHRG